MGTGIGPMSASERPSYDPSGRVLERIIHFLREREDRTRFTAVIEACVSDRTSWRVFYPLRFKFHEFSIIGVDRLGTRAPSLNNSFSERILHDRLDTRSTTARRCER